VLTSETNYFAAELKLAQAELNERLALVQLYSALGGGWQQQVTRTNKQFTDLLDLIEADAICRTCIRGALRHHRRVLFALSARVSIGLCVATAGNACHAAHLHRQFFKIH
jgi:hypothetical protein